MTCCSNQHITVSNLTRQIACREHTCIHHLAARASVTGCNLITLFNEPSISSFVSCDSDQQICVVLLLAKQTIVLWFTSDVYLC